MNNEIIEQGEKLPATDQYNVDPMQIIATAVQQGMGPGEIAQLVELQKSMKADAAKEAFVRAMAEFKRNPPQIVKDVQVSFSGTHYKHADLARASDAISAALLEHGLMHNWETETLENGKCRVTCIITHVDGHSERASMEAAPDTSGAKNSIQAQGSTVSYLQRYTLLSVVGIVAAGVDNDGAGYAPKQAEKISPEDVKVIDDLIELHDIDKGKFLGWAKVERLSDITVDKLESINKGLAESIKRKKAQSDESS